MVRLSQIYTKTGDDGTTGLGDGTRVSKAGFRVQAYGDVDEANAAVGMCVWEAQKTTIAAPISKVALSELLKSIQNDLFDIGADLCCPIHADDAKAEYPRLRVIESQVTRLEQVIDDYNAPLKPLDSFVLPGGNALSSVLHLARTITRRAERTTAALLEHEAAATNPFTLLYLNRLSDLLFVLSRSANDPSNTGPGDVKWIPGKLRTHT